MKLCNATITVFNARYNQETGFDSYQPTVIRGVSWFCDIAAIVNDKGLKAANKFTIRIPENADFSGKNYTDPADYDTADPTKFFTLRSGDVIVRGALESTEMKPSDLQKVNGEMVTVLGVTDNRRAPNAKHWKVVGS